MKKILNVLKLIFALCCISFALYAFTVDKKENYSTDIDDIEDRNTFTVDNFLKW